MNTMTINGMTISVEEGSSIYVMNGNVFVNGQKQDLGDVKVGSLVIEGNCGDIKSDGNVTVNGNTGSIKAAGNVRAMDVHGDVKASGNVACKDVGGKVKAGGNVSCR